MADVTEAWWEDRYAYLVESNRDCPDDLELRDGVYYFDGGKKCVIAPDYRSAHIARLEHWGMNRRETLT